MMMMLSDDDHDGYFFIIIIIILLYWISWLLQYKFIHNHIQFSNTVFDNTKHLSRDLCNQILIQINLNGLWIYFMNVPYFSIFVIYLYFQPVFPYCAPIISISLYIQFMCNKSVCIALNVFVKTKYSINDITDVTQDHFVNVLFIIFDFTNKNYFIKFVFSYN